MSFKSVNKDFHSNNSKHSNPNNHKESDESDPLSKHCISIGFLRVHSNPFIDNNYCDIKYLKNDPNIESIQLNDKKQNALKTLNTFWKNGFNEINVASNEWTKSCHSPHSQHSLHQTRPLFERNKRQFICDSKRQHLIPWKINETKSESQECIQSEESCSSTAHIGSKCDYINKYTTSDLKANVDQFQINDNYSANDSLIFEKLQFIDCENVMKLNRQMLSNETIDQSMVDSVSIESNKVRKKRKKSTIVNKRLVSKFIDSEAEVVYDTKQSFSDDEENTQKDIMNSSLSFVDDKPYIDSQPIGQMIGGIDSRTTEDMKSVYLQSVKEGLIGECVKYKLKYDFDPNIDVYSQEPNPSETGDYEMDSFCVPNDCLIYEDSPPNGSQLEVSPKSPSPQMKLRPRKKFKRIIFNP